MSIKSLFYAHTTGKHDENILNKESVMQLSTEVFQGRKNE
jgi:hypothetical protein